MVQTHTQSAATGILPAMARTSSRTREEVLLAQARWANGVVEIGRAKLNGEDYRARARRFLSDLYAFESGIVLFKPTLAAEQPFRKTFNEALSYFVGGDIPEDRGFALRPWASVEFGDQHIMVVEEGALAMGEYFFTPHEDPRQVVRVEYTFTYVRDEDGVLRIRSHHSSLPFAPEARAA